MLCKWYCFEDNTIVVMMAYQMILFTAIAVAIMSILVDVRHTRADEEAGRIELIRSFPTGRLGNLSATIILAFGMKILLAMLLCGSLNILLYQCCDLVGSPSCRSTKYGTSLFK